MGVKAGAPQHKKLPCYCHRVYQTFRINGLDSTGSRWDQIMKFCELGNEPLTTIMGISWRVRWLPTVQRTSYVMSNLGYRCLLPNLCHKSAHAEAGCTLGRLYISCICSDIFQFLCLYHNDISEAVEYNFFNALYNLRLAHLLVPSSCRFNQVEQTSANTVTLHSLDYKEKHLKLQVHHLVVLTSPVREYTSWIWHTRYGCDVADTARSLTRFCSIS